MEAISSFVEPPCKIAKLEMAEDQSIKERCSFDGFCLDAIISENPERKTLFIKGRFGASCDGDNGSSENNAVVLLEKSPFDRNVVDQILSDKTRLVETLKNDIYHTYLVYPPVELNAVKATIIHPCTQKHIDKYSFQDVYLLEETVDDYKTITRPHIEQQILSIQWVFNILEKKREAERIIYENPDPENGFILLPDMKWDLKDTSALYLSAIVHKRGIKSIRDLRKEHLPMLKSIEQIGKKTIEDKYKVPGSQLRIYFHYLPSYYHLHIHFTHIKFNAPGSGTERAHLLSQVIANLDLDGDYYTKVPLTCVLRESDLLLAKYREAGKL